MTCPSCAADVTPEPVTGTLLICHNCLRSLVLGGDALRLAVADDTVNLSDNAIDALKKARKRLRKAQA